MGLLSPFLLASAAAMAVPLWLHLRRKRRQVPLEFPSLRYLKIASARMRRQARIEDPWLLALRLLLLALLATAFARPVVRSQGGWFGTARPLESVLVIDTTASMGWQSGAGSRLDVAKRLARDWIEGLDPSDAVAVWVLSDRLERPVPVPVTDRAQLVRAIEATRISEGSSSLAAVFNAAHEWELTSQATRKELVIITDNQSTTWDWPAEGFFKRVWNRESTGLVVLTPDSIQASNTSVASVEWEARAVHQGSLLKGMARLVNFGDKAVNDLLECRVAGQVLMRSPVEIPAGGSLEVPLTLPVPVMDGPVLTGDVALVGDALACDDHWYFALPVHRTLNALVVDRSDAMSGTMRPSFFLSKALAAGGSCKISTLESKTWRTQTSDGIDSLWFTAGAITDENAWLKALTYAETGGTVVVTGDWQPDPMMKNWPVTAGEETQLPATRMATRLVAPSHPLFDGVWNEQTPFPPVPQKIARTCAAAKTANVLATLAGDYPLLVEMLHGTGRILWLNASADRSWGDLPLSPAFVPLVQQIARAKDLVLQTSTSRWAGESWPDLTQFPGNASWPADVDGQSTLALHSGCYDSQSQNSHIPWRCAVNVRRNESDLRPIPTDQLQTLLPGHIITGTQGIRKWRNESRREVPLWPCLLAAAALIYLIEGRQSMLAAQRRLIAADNLSPIASNVHSKKRSHHKRSTT
jgi:hypothetical protein